MPSIEPYQYGCIRGSSTAVYLVWMYYLIVKWLDTSNSIVYLLFVDCRKVFGLVIHLKALTNLTEMGAKNQTLVLVIVTEFLWRRLQSFYPLFAEDNCSEWPRLTFGSPQATKLVPRSFLAVIKRILAEFEECFKFVDDLSALLKYTALNGVSKHQFGSTLFIDFITQCQSNDLQVKEQK